MIYVKAVERSAAAVVDDVLTTGSVGFAVTFAFSAEWDGLAKTAVFKTRTVSVDVLLTGDTCTVPPEVLAQAGDNLYIGVYGTDGGGDMVIPTVYADAGLIRTGTKPSGVSPEIITPSLADQVLSAASKAVETSERAEGKIDDALQRANADLEEARETLDAADKAQKAAAEQADNAERSANAAARSAELAGEVAVKNGYFYFEINESGHLIETRTDNVGDDLTFALQDGRLKVTYE